jgi:hypothetical protein
MASVQVGVVTAAQVNGPIANPQTKLVDPSSGGFWAGVWFVVALVLLFIVL